MEKIVIFTPTLNIGGIERVLLTYAKGLGIRGYDVIYLTCAGKGDFKPEPYKNVQFINLNVSRLRKSLFALVKFLRETKPDIIFTANDSTLIIFLAKILSGISTKVITSQHNYYKDNGEVGLRQKSIIKYIYPYCHKIIAVSTGIQKMLIYNFKLSPYKVVTIYNPIDVKEILRLSEEPVEVSCDKYILFVGRLSIVKNLPLLFKSFSIFIKSHPDVKLLVIGDGEDKQNILNAMHELRLEDFVFFLGTKPNPFPYIKKAEMIVLSSKTEALPTILLESLVLSKTIVSTPTLGALDILKNGELGYLSECIYDEEDFLDTLKKAYLNGLKRADLFSIVKQEYDLDTKVIELEKLWK